MGDPTFEAMRSQGDMGGGNLAADMGIGPFDMSGVTAPPPAQVAPQGNTLGEQVGLNSGLGRYQKYIDALTDRMKDQFEPQREPSLGERMGIFAMAMANPAMARDVLRQKAEEELARKQRNQQLQNSILVHGIQMGELEARSEEADRDYKLGLMRTQAYAAQVARSGERRGAGRAVDGALQRIRELRRQRMEAVANDPNLTLREKYYADLLRNGKPGGMGRQQVSPAEARAMAEAAYPLPAGGDEEMAGGSSRYNVDPSGGQNLFGGTLGIEGSATTLGGLEAPSYGGPPSLTYQGDAGAVDPSFDYAPPDAELSDGDLLDGFGG